MAGHSVSEEKSMRRTTGLVLGKMCIHAQQSKSGAGKRMAVASAARNWPTSKKYLYQRSNRHLLHSPSLLTPPVIRWSIRTYISH